MYNIADKKILEWGINKNQEDSAEEKDPNMIYVENVFWELNNIYLRGDHSNGNFKHDKNDDYLMHAMVVFLRGSIKEVNRDIDSDTPLRHHFSMVIPTSWGNDIQKELIRPLFVQAGLIAEGDDEKRLLFFTELEALVQFMKRPREIMFAVAPKFENGREYILYTLYFTSEKLSVTLDLFSIHYPIYAVISTEYTSTLLKSLSFSIPFNINIENSIQRCLQTRGFDIELAETKNIMHLLKVQYYKQEVEGFI
ncbi:uncharacterized protein EV154DRAFT_262111 [Mucor mucedo]|uniref:uncharacterized protein n=1 Tax=Mucor mucedo TaxID=29922 RepID=UPI00221FEE69|nr:uncharacterized protein EV154DRAFT_262111 [Mucor mucedo]KAI7890068.1 hypothetical protein EV154DRAFT_262111 [Mucor mucedo]